MRTGEIVDLANERRLSAVLDFTSLGGELLILNGGSRAEECVVVTIVDSRIRSEHRAAYCIDSGTSMHLFVPMAATDAPSSVTLRIIGGHGEMLLAPPARTRVRPHAFVRGWSSLAAVALLVLLAGGRLDAPTSLASADPEPAAVEAPLVKPSLSLHVPTNLPNVLAVAAPAHKLAPVPPHVAHVATRRADAVAIAAVASPAVPKRQEMVQPDPQMTDLRVPSTAKSGDFVPVSFGAVAHQVKIVASIGPTIVARTVIGAQHGSIAIRAPKSDLDSRIMTVRATAQVGNRTSTLQAMVVLVRP